ncbi:MAG: lyase domain protein repeat-containing protein [Verrucomicrobia bacterium]|nr:lyase domain protein repeat-containing protein [Verrucomicrobiota bacterium]
MTSFSRPSFLARAAALLAFAVCSVVARASPATAADVIKPGESARRPLQAYCGAGDHWWTAEREPVDSPATIRAMFEWMSKTYQIGTMYWRGGQQELWHEYYRFGQEAPLTYDSEFTWAKYMMYDVHTNEVAVQAAHQNGMRIVLYTGLFEHGVQPDQGILSPHPWEDRARIEHPEWCPLDRWGERRAPGPLSFSHREVRDLLARRYIDFVTQRSYDGIIFYTYVENHGTRYPEEFDYSAPILAEFDKRYPGVDPRSAPLTFEQQAHLAVCRGQFVTAFLRQLHDGLKSSGKTLTMILDAKNPDRGQAWWSRPPSSTGNIAMEWERWIKEGIVDEFYVQLGSVEDQQRLLDRLLEATRGTPIKLAVRTLEPFKESSWAKYAAAGVALTPCITSPTNDLDRIALEATSPETIRSGDWRLRLQTLADMGGKKLPADTKAAASATRDPHPLVRRKALQVLAALNAGDQVTAVEAALHDPENSVRVTAAVTLKTIHGPKSAPALLAALASERVSSFLLRLMAADTLAAIGSDALPVVLEGTGHSSAAVRETCIRALRLLAKPTMSDAVFSRLQSIMMNPATSAVDRYWSAITFSSARAALSEAQRETCAQDLLKLIRSDTPPLVQIRAAMVLGELQPTMASATQAQAVEALGTLFRRYGTGSRRSDAAFGWRLVGNALDRFGPPGRGVLESFRVQKEDEWLAWFAYEVTYLPLRGAKADLTTEAEAVATHAKYAPKFPGWRTWNQPDATGTN